MLETDTLYYGDCLDWMQRWDDQSVDLIYLDPPFNSNVDYNILYSSDSAGDAQFRAFSDTWTWDEAAADRFAAYEGALGRPAHGAIAGLGRILGPSGMLAYLTYMAERLEQMRRLLKPTGSIYLHCDPTASHYLKALMDAIFGHQNFKNEIVWHYSGWNRRLNHKFNSRHDIILLYGKGRSPNFNSYAEPWSSEEEYVRTRKQKVWEDVDGRTYVLSDAGSGQRIRRYLDEAMSYGQPVDDVWNIGKINNSAAEHISYPTQKPLALLERIIRASSNEGDIILDPFCGCGTTIDAARKLRRRWAGIDISSFAIDLIHEKRLRDPTIPTKGIPTDLASARKLATEKPFDFESWAVTRMPGFRPNTKKVADGGVDGRAVLATKPDNYDSRLALAQVKGGKFSLSTLRDFIHVTHRDKAALGCYVTLNPVETSAARMEIANAGKISVSGYAYPRMQIWPISEYFEQRLPSLPVMNDPYSGKPLAQETLF